MRVVVVHNLYRSENPSGENSVVESDIKQLRADGVEVVPFMRDSDEIASFTIVGQAGLVAQPVCSPADSIEFRRLLRRVRPDVVHLHNPYPLVSPWVLRSAHSLGVPIVQTVHNYRHRCLNGIQFRDGAPCTDCVSKTVPWPGVLHGCYQGSRLASLPMATALVVHRPTWKQVSMFLPVGEGVAQELRNLGIPDGRITLRPNVVPDLGEPTVPGSGALFVGRLSAEKGIELLLDAWQSHCSGSGHTLTIAGDGELRPLVEAAASVDPSVRYLGMVPSEELIQHYRSAALVVVPSACAEADPLVIATAMSMGRATVATNIGVMPLRIDTSCGWLAAPSAFAEILRSALDSPAAMRERGSGARARYVERLVPTPERSLLRVYSDLLGNNPVNTEPSKISHGTAGKANDSISNYSEWVWRRPFGFGDRVDMIVTGQTVPLAAMSIYPGQRMSARIGAALGTRLLRAGAGRRAACPDLPLNALTRELQVDFDAFAVMTSSTLGRWIIGCQSAGRLRVVAKVGELDDKALAHEGSILRELDGRTTGFGTPQLLFDGELEGHRVLATRAVSGEGIRRLNLPEIALLTARLTAGQDGVPSVTHGDLAPWNLRRSADQLILLDWESAVFQSRPLWDLTHFVIQSGSLLGRYSPVEIINLLTAASSPGDIHLQALGLDLSIAARLLREYLDETSKLVEPEQAKFRRKVMAALDTGS